MTSKPRRHAHGITLIELMIVMIVVAVLAAIAYPSFRDSVRKGRRTDATIALGDFASRMDRYYTDNNTFATATIASSPAAATDVLATTSSPDGNYTLSIVAQAATTFSIRATPAGAQTGDPCGQYTLTNTGARSVTGTAPYDLAYCWP